MELRTYLWILVKKWWIIVPVFLVTLTSSIFLTFTQTPMYSSKATFLVRPIENVGDTRIYTTVLNLLSNREQILTTYTEVATGTDIRQRAAERIGLESLRGYNISSDLIKGANMMTISVEGPDPETVQALTKAVGDVTIEEVAKVYPIFTLGTHESAKLPRNQTSPNIARNLTLAVILGAVMGISVAFLVSYLEAPSEATINVNIIDTQTGVYNRQYFLQRLGEEMVRSKRNHHPLSIAIMRVEDLDMIHGFNKRKLRYEALNHVGVLIKQHLRDEDIVSYLGEDVFAFLLPDLNGQQAQNIMEYLQTRITWAPFQSQTADLKLNLRSTVGIASYNHDGISRNQFLSSAVEALQSAETDGQGKVYLQSDLVVS